jgi:hypothetical protein
MWYEYYSKCGCMGKATTEQRLPGYCGTHGNDWASREHNGEIKYSSPTMALEAARAKFKSYGMSTSIELEEDYDWESAIMDDYLTDIKDR